MGLSCIKFGITLSQLKLDGITLHHTIASQMRKFDINALIPSRPLIHYSFFVLLYDSVIIL